MRKTPKRAPSVSTRKIETVEGKGGGQNFANGACAAAHVKDGAGAAFGQEAADDQAGQPVFDLSNEVVVIAGGPILVEPEVVLGRFKRIGAVEIGVVGHGCTMAGFRAFAMVGGGRAFGFPCASRAPQSLFGQGLNRP